MSEKRIWSCDRCGFRMTEHNCKVSCPNCGARWDCSDVTIWVGDGSRVPEPSQKTGKQDRD